MLIREALDADVGSIFAVLCANRNDSSLFQQPEHQVRRTLGDFILATDEMGILLGCAALHWHSEENAEILAVAVVPEAQGHGVGGALMCECVQRAISKSPDGLCLWLATAKPGYFQRFGFLPIPGFRLPFLVLWTKFRLVLQQPPARWVPALLGRHTFMKYAAFRA
jgi:amino-acid N-acetyltransferase